MRARDRLLLIVLPLLLGTGALAFPRDPRHFAGGVVILAFVAVFGLGALWMRKAVHVGADGISIGNRLWRRFIPASQIAGALPAFLQLAEDAWEAQPAGVRVLLRDGTERFLPMVGLEAQVAPALDRIRELAGMEPPELPALARNGRTVDEWRRAVAALAEPPDFRSARVPAEQIEQLLLDARAPNGQRLGAALALAGSKDPAARRKIRLAAAATAEPRMRSTLEQISTESAEGVERVLAEAPADARRTERP